MNYLEVRVVDNRIALSNSMINVDNALRNERSGVSLQFLLSQKIRDSPQDSASLSRRAAGLGTWRCLSQELWRGDAGV